MSKREERQVFDMAKQDIPFLKDLELVKHDDRPDFVLKDKNGRIIGLEHFRADVYRVVDESNFHVSGGHTVLDKSKNEVFQKYHSFSVDNTWTDQLLENATNDVLEIANDSLNMQRNYKYEDFLDNLRVGIHGRLPKVKGHIQKSQNYPNRANYDLMGFLIEVPIPSFQYYFETTSSQKISRAKSLVCRYPLATDIPNLREILRQYNNGYSYQRIAGLPITNEIWRELDIFDDIDFVIIETYNSKNTSKKLAEHHGQYFDKSTPKLKIYPAFSFGLTNITSMDTYAEHREGKINILFNMQANQPKYDVSATKTMLKNERRKLDREERKHFDKVTKDFCK